MMDAVKLAVVGVVLLLLGGIAIALGVLPAQDALAIADRVWPILLFVVAVTIVAELAAAAGVFDVAAFALARLGRGRTWALWGLVVFLALAARHLAAGGRVLIEHHPLDWAETAEPTRPTPGATVGMVDVVRDPPFVAAVSVYDVGGRIVRQPFTARVLSNPELDDALASRRARGARPSRPAVLRGR